MVRVQCIVYIYSVYVHYTLYTHHACILYTHQTLYVPKNKMCRTSFPYQGRTSKFDGQLKHQAQFMTSWIRGEGPWLIEETLQVQMKLLQVLQQTGHL